MTNLTHENIFFTKLFGVCPVSNANIVTELYNIARNGEIKTVRVLSFVKNLCTTFLFRIPILFEYCT